MQECSLLKPVTKEKERMETTSITPTCAGWKILQQYRFICNSNVKYHLVRNQFYLKGQYINYKGWGKQTTTLPLSHKTRFLDYEIGQPHLL